MIRLSALLHLALATVLAAPSSAQTAAEWATQGRALLDSGKNDAAVKAFEKAVKLDDKSSMYHLNLAEALGAVANRANVFKQGLMARRIKGELERARALDPTRIGPHEGLLQFYLQAPGIMGGGLDKARLEAADIGKLNRLLGHFALADIARHEKDSAAVEREYRAAAAEYPDSASAYGTLAFYFYNTKRTAEAFATIDNVLARHPDEPMGLYYVGRLAALSGQQLDRGEAALRKFLALAPNPSDKTRVAPASAHFRLGEVLVKKGDKAGARTEFETALQLNPRLQAARNALKSLRD